MIKSGHFFSEGKQSFMASPVNSLANDRRIAQAMLEISYAVGSVMEIDNILQKICTVGAKVMETDTCSIYLTEEDNPDWLALVATKGLSRAEELGVRGFHWGDGIPGWAAKNNKTIAIADARKDERSAPLDDTKEEMKFIAYLCTPLRIQDEVIGIMSVRREHPKKWTEEEIVFAEFVSKQAAIVLEKSRLYEQKVTAEHLAGIAISLNGVAHYVKNIIQGMSGGTFFVNEGVENKDYEKIKAGWKLLKRSNEKIRNLTENMLMYSREQACELEEASLNDIIAEMAAEVKETAQQRGIDLFLQLDQKVPPLQLDSTALHDVMLNLVTNAMDAIPDPGFGRIDIATCFDPESNKVHVAVSDDGMGIPQEAQEKIYNLFFSTKGRRGTGIGLAVTKKIVEEHGGALQFKSIEGEGTTFYLAFPVH
jgi:signal transduction histidine kinase